MRLLKLVICSVLLACLVPHKANAVFSVNWPASFNISYIRDYSFLITGTDFGASPWSVQAWWGGLWFTTPLTVSSVSCSGGGYTGTCSAVINYPDRSWDPARIGLVQKLRLHNGAALKAASANPMFAVQPPTITQPYTFDVSLAGNQVTMSGHFMNSFGCKDSSNYYLMALQLVGTSLLAYPTGGCIPGTTSNSFFIPRNDAGGSYQVKLVYDEAHSWNKFGKMYYNVYTNYHAPQISSLSRSSLPLSGASIFINGNYFGDYTVGSFSDFFDYVMVTDTANPVLSNTAAWRSVSNTAIWVDLPSECDATTLRGLTLTYGNNQYVTLPNSIKYDWPSLTGCATCPISSANGGVMKLTGTNLGTNCNFWTYADGGGIASSTLIACTDTYVSWSMPPGGVGTNVDAHLGWCSSAYTTCVGCISFV